jgi:hypothetical protein
MSSVDEGLATQVRNIEEKYGKTMAEWTGLIKASGLTKHAEIIALLKEQYGLTHGSANRVALIARGADAASLVKAAEVTGADPIDAMFAGKKDDLRPIHAALVAAIQSFGDDVELAPKKGYISLRRKRQFGIIQPSTATRLDVGLVLKDVPASARLEPAGSFNAMCTHRVRISSVAEVDAELINWLREAYHRAG